LVSPFSGENGLSFARWFRVGTLHTVLYHAGYL
jgi:hypothetical protein